MNWSLKEVAGVCVVLALLFIVIGYSVNYANENNDRLTNSSENVWEIVDGQMPSQN